jgi:hypothetical protein
MSCPNRIDFDQDDEGPMCGDESGLCSACDAKEAAYWGSYFGIRPEMSREARQAQLEAFAPPGRSVYEPNGGES